MLQKVIWFLKCFKRALSYRSFWNVNDWLKLMLMEYQIPFEQSERQYQLYEKKYAMYNNYIKEHFAKYRMIDYQGCKPTRNDINNQNIWVCWLQGEDAMPDIVKVCYRNLIKYRNGHNVILITWNNLFDYLDISSTIIDKVGKGMSFTAFSDYVRLNLLSIYGGLWIDATFYVTAPIDNTIFQTRFFSIKNNVRKNDVVCRYLWAVNFVYNSGDNEFMRHIRNMFCFFWEMNKKPINYLFMDYCYEYERTVNNDFDNLLKRMPYTNEHSHQLRLNFNKPFNTMLLKHWMSDTSLFKLSYKGLLKENIYTQEGEETLTFYGYVIKQLKQ